MQLALIEDCFRVVLQMRLCPSECSTVGYQVLGWERSNGGARLSVTTNAFCASESTWLARLGWRAAPRRTRDVVPLKAEELRYLSSVKLSSIHVQKSKLCGSFWMEKLPRSTVPLLLKVGKIQYS